MLGEDHSLLNEFPELKDTIVALSEKDEAFAAEVKKYDALDKEIRKLELRDSPISDEEMHAKKVERADLKDDLYKKLKAA